MFVESSQTLHKDSGFPVINQVVMLRTFQKKKKHEIIIFDNTVLPLTRSTDFPQVQTRQLSPIHVSKHKKSTPCRSNETQGECTGSNRTAVEVVFDAENFIQVVVL